jgi:hypothetical protein
VEILAELKNWLLINVEFHVFASPDTDIPYIPLRRLKTEPEAE